MMGSEGFKTKLIGLHLEFVKKSSNISLRIHVDSKSWWLYRVREVKYGSFRPGL